MNHFLTERLNRRGFLRMAGATTVGAAVLAACRKAENVGGGATGPSGAAVHPPIGQEPGNLQVFDWSGYGNGDYYPDKERLSLWQQYADATGDTPQFILFANDDAGYTKAATGAVRFDVVHPCFYKYRDWVDLGAVQPWDTSLISNFSSLNPKLQEQGVLDGKQYFIPLDWGFIAPIVNLDHVDVKEETFGILFDDRYAGKISWVDTSNMMYIGGLFLGVSNAFDMTDDELAQVRDFLLAWYYYGHTNTKADVSVVSPGVVAALGLDDPTVLDPPKAIPESYIPRRDLRSEEHTSELQSRRDLVCRLLLEKKKKDWLLPDDGRKSREKAEAEEEL